SFLRLHRPSALTPFPYTTLFRSGHEDVEEARGRTRAERGPTNSVDAPARAVLDRPLAAETARFEPQRRETEARIVGEHDPSSRRSEEHTSELQSRFDLVCRLLLE